VDISHRYPELIERLRNLPPGTVIDGEIVVMQNGRPEFQLLQSREQARTKMKIELGSRHHPAVFICFDQLYKDYASIMTARCHERRAVLRDTLATAKQDLLVMSEGIVGHGIEYFERVCAQELEGMVAKRLDSPYLPGKRLDAWQKIKRQQSVVCAIIGYVPEGERDLRNIVLAADVEGTLRYVGRVGSGFSDAIRFDLLERLRPRRRTKPIVNCRVTEAIWVEPHLFCTVRFMEWTRDHHLRAPVYGGLYEANDR
ncbi:MAG TPA: hypothetical protein VL282_07320, partial [Tepidisphaeraceae bacterium]|nr:hypothetical protein [Tepidisphaeraceae bacterium]